MQQPLILILGKNGQVGWELCRSIAIYGKLENLDSAKLDLRNIQKIRDTIQRIKPDIIINAAAFTNTENAESNLEETMLVNGDAPGVIAEEAKKLNSFLIHYSTDYVFDGEKQQDYVETDLPNPLNAYGKSKLKGEQEILSVGGRSIILRVSGIYSNRGNNFLLKIMDRIKTSSKINVVSDQISAPCSARLVSEVTAVLVKKNVEDTDKLNQPKLYHLSTDGEVSWCDFSKEILKTCDQIDQSTDYSNVIINPITSDKIESKVIRPKYSKLSSNLLKKDYNITIPDWRYVLQRCIEEVCDRP